MPILPSGITTAIGQQTAASQARMQQGGRGRKARMGKGGRTRKGKRAAAPAKRKRAASRRRSTSKRTKLKAGSPAAKAWGRKMRAARRKK